MSATTLSTFYPCVSGLDKILYIEKKSLGTLSNWEGIHLMKRFDVMTNQFTLLTPVIR